MPLIELTKEYDLVYNFFDILKQNGNQVLDFVIIHLFFQCSITK